MTKVTWLKIYRTGAVAYCACLAIWFALWLAWGDANWWLMVLNYVAVYSLAPAPLLIGLAFTSRRWSWLTLVPVLMFTVWYGPYVIPQRPPPQPQPALRVLNSNVLYSNDRTQDIVALIQEVKPDLIALQEVTQATYQALQESLGTEYRWSMLGPARPYGSAAVFSRHPVSEFQAIDLQADSRVAVLALATVKNQPITFISAHLSAYGLQWVPWTEVPSLIELRTFEQNRQAEILAQTVQAQAAPAILACDCNAHLTNDTYRLLQAAMNNSARPSIGNADSLAPTGADVEQRLNRIEYVFHRGALAPVGVYVIREMAGSDHHPLVADYEIGP